MPNTAPEIKPVSQKMIADQMKVSIATVSKALNGHTDISPEMRRQVEIVADKLGYRFRSARKQGTSSQSSRSTSTIISALIRRPLDSGMEDRATYLSRLTRRAAQMNVSVVVQELGKDDDPLALLDSRNQSPAIREGLVSGIALGGLWPEEVVRKLSKRHKVVLFPQKVAGCKVDVVESDKLGAMRQMIGRLHELGHERIGFLGRCGSMPMVSDIFAGYASAISQVGLPFDNNWVIDIDREMMLTEGNEQRWREMVDQAESLKKNDKVDAWVCCNDWPAYQLYRGMADRGYSIPEDLSITGFDDNEPANLGCPPVTSAKVPIEAICGAVLNRLVNPGDSPVLQPTHSTLACEIVDYGTIGPPSSAKAGAAVRAETKDNHSNEEGA